MNLFGFISVFLLSSSVYTQTTYTFTNAGATGRTGPTQSQVNSTYSSGNNLNNGVTINTQGYQEWTVPANGVYTIEVWGAQGGNAGGGNTAVGYSGLLVNTTGACNTASGIESCLLYTSDAADE